MVFLLGSYVQEDLFEMLTYNACVMCCNLCSPCYNMPGERKPSPPPLSRPYNEHMFSIQPSDLGRNALTKHINFYPNKIVCLCAPTRTVGRWTVKTTRKQSIQRANERQHRAKREKKRWDNRARINISTNPIKCNMRIRIIWILRTNDERRTDSEFEKYFCTYANFHAPAPANVPNSLFGIVSINV